MMSFSCSMKSLAVLTVLCLQGCLAGMFRSVTQQLIPSGTSQLNYGVAVTNVGEAEGAMEWVVSGYNGANIVLQRNNVTGTYTNIAQPNTPYAALMDPSGAAIGVCACDVDGDGKEEIYFLNTNGRYSGPNLVKDKLFKWRNGRYEDLFSDAVNRDVSAMFAGRSVACVDRTGNGKYAILVATYAQDSQGKFGLIEMNEADPRNNVATGNIVLHDIAVSQGIDFSTGGRGIVVGPILGDDGFSDIYFVNEGNFRMRNRGDNALFKNDGTGRFTNVAPQLGLNDPSPGRGVTVTDFNNDGLIDIAYGNWMNPHKLFLQSRNSQGVSSFMNVATSDYANSSPIRTVIAADFDNNGNQEIFMNNIYYYGPAPNNLFEIVPTGSSVSIVRKDIGDALESSGYGTGGAAADVDNDGRLELLVAHGESNAEGITLYQVNEGASNNWLRVMPLTQFGAPARGAKVTVTLAGSATQMTRVIDGGSGYLCAMEPVAHFGLGSSTASQVKVTWPNGQTKMMSLTSTDTNKMHKISISGATSSSSASAGLVGRRGASGEPVASTVLRAHGNSRASSPTK